MCVSSVYVCVCIRGDRQTDRDSNINRKTPTDRQTERLVLTRTIELLFQWTPYIMEEERNGRTEYHGFSMDLLEIFSQAMNFR